ncbi:hypothetical protein SLEP1_g45404 [Rubroshorea leprosula]|uniref:Uncharacterized protein n=1 Tax=Rubroshorea leprosula TaxID=152421 RepID=A0AAV5LLH6_9ROSI|nr:hypothetical protein SLEP1_g45404 [Rubroshorea leprosula]
MKIVTKLLISPFLDNSCIRLVQSLHIHQYSLNGLSRSIYAIIDISK